MTNPEHLKILKQGVETWNRWRRDHPNVVPSLGGANLGGAKLSGADPTGRTSSGLTSSGPGLRGERRREGTPTTKTRVLRMMVMMMMMTTTALGNRCGD